MRNYLIILLLLVTPAHAEKINFKWIGDYPHNSSSSWSKNNPHNSGWSRNFQNGAPEEHGIIAKDGTLNGFIYLPKNVSGPMPFIVLMHPCGGLDGFNMAWVDATAERFNAEGYGVLAPDSYATRGVAIKCGSAAGLHWGYRRGEDAYSALDYLIERKLAKPDEVYVMGYSNGGLATLIAMSSKMRDHSNKFAAGFAIVPACGPTSVKNSTFYNPIIIFSAGDDSLTPAKHCEELGQRNHATPVQVVVLKRANHGFMFNRAPAVSEGVKYSYDAPSTEITLGAILNAMRTKQFAKNSVLFK